MQNGVLIYPEILFRTYPDECFFDKNLNEIIHPNAENIPEYIRHFASAIFINDSFWNDSNKVLKELKM